MAAGREARPGRTETAGPLTGAKWEGGGVTPDDALPDEEARAAANRETLRRVLARRGDPSAGPRPALRDEIAAALADEER